MLHTIPLTVVETRKEVDDIKELLSICKHYHIALRCELKRKVRWMRCVLRLCTHAQRAVWALVLPLVRLCLHAWSVHDSISCMAEGRWPGAQGQGQGCIAVPASKQSSGPANPTALGITTWHDARPRSSSPHSPKSSSSWSCQQCCRPFVHPLLCQCMPPQEPCARPPPFVCVPRHFHPLHALACKAQGPSSAAASLH